MAQSKVYSYIVLIPELCKFLRKIYNHLSYAPKPSAEMDRKFVYVLISLYC